MLKFVIPKTPIFQAVIISKFPNILIIICIVKINPNVCFQIFINSSGWCFVIFPAISFKIPFKKKKCDICVNFGSVLIVTLPYGGLLILFFLNRFRYFLWILKFLLFLFLCFSVYLFCCFSCFYAFLPLYLSVFPIFSVILIFPGFLLLCYSCFSLFYFPIFFVFYFSCFIAFLFLCFSISICPFL